VDFDSFEEAARAVREKDHKVFHEKFGDRYVRLIQVCIRAGHVLRDVVMGPWQRVTWSTGTLMTCDQGNGALAKHGVGQWDVDGS